MMDGYDCQLYERLQEKVRAAGFEMEIRGRNIFILSCGGFENVNDAYQYMCGYERGLAPAK